MGEQETQVERRLPFPGAVDHEGKVTFTLFAPGKYSVNLIGDFNDWNLHADPMVEISPGLWSLERELPRGTFAYQFLIDGQLVICDPYARYVQDEPGPGPTRALVKPRESPYAWRHDDWARPAFKDLQIYELHIADFTAHRSFDGARKRLNYVRDLGLNAIELMPVFGVREDPGWGYAPVHLFAPNKNYGTPNELRALIDEAHGLGLAVILDMVLAHTGPDHVFNRMYPFDQSPWYGIMGEPNEFGLPQFDYRKEPARWFVRDVLEYWLNDYHIDGFRFDYLKIVGVSEDGKHGIPTLGWAARQARPDAYLIGELLPEDPQAIRRSGLDGSWHAYLSYALKALLCRCEKYGYDYHTGFVKCVSTLDPHQSGYGDNPLMMVNYVESHDEHRLVLEMIDSGIDMDGARSRSALAATILFTLAGEPMIYSGQSWGEASPKNMDHNFQSWEQLDSPPGKILHDHYQRMATLRRDHDCLRSPNFRMEAVYEEQKSIVYHRWNGVGGEILVAANFSDQVQKVKVPFPTAGVWLEFTGNQEQYHEGTVEMEIGAGAALVFIKRM